MSGLLAQQTERLNQKYGTTTNIHAGWQPNAATIGTKANSTPVRSDNSMGGYLGSVLNSIKGAAGAGANAVGGYLHQTANEIGDWAKYAGGNLGRFMQTPFKAIGNYQQFQKDHNFNQYVQAQKNLAGQSINAYRGSVGIVPTKELIQKGTPVGLTAASLVLPFAKGGTALKAAGDAADGLSLGEKALAGGRNFVSSAVTGSGRLAAGVENPILNAGAKIGSGLAYNALVTRPTMESLQQAGGDIGQLGNNLIHGKQLNNNLDVKNAALNAAGIFTPAIATGLTKLGKGAAGFIGKNIFDTSGVFDKVMVKGNKSINKALGEVLKEAQTSGDPKLLRNAKTMENKLRVMQDLLLQEADGNAELAAKNLQRYQSEFNSFDHMDIQDAIKEMTQHIKARINVQRMAANGAFGERGDKLAQKAGNFTVGRMTEKEQSAIVKRLQKTQDAAKEVEALKKEGILQNRNAYLQLKSAAQESPEKALAVAKGMTTVRPLEDAAGNVVRLNNGYVAAFSPKAGVVHKAAETANLVTGQEARFGGIGRAIEKVGLSPKGVDPALISKELETKLGQRLAGTQFDGSEKKIIQSLRKAAGNTATAVDPRQLSLKKYSEVLGHVSRSEAKIVRNAVSKAFMDLPASMVGAGGKLINAVSAIPKLGTAEQYYLRAKGAGSYQYNPFFQGKVLTKSAAINMLEGGNPFMKVSQGTKDALMREGYFAKWKSDAGMADLLGNIDGMNGKEINLAQQHLVGSLAESLAKANGTTVDKILANKNTALYKEFDHALSTVTGYGKGGYLNSPLAKTLNVLVFPSRFNTKVLTVAGKAFAKQNPATQIAIVKQLANGKQWLDSPQGKTWQKDNADLLKTIDYFTPTHTIQSVLNSISSGKIADLGQFGGMPFGVIQSMLKVAGAPMPLYLQQSKHEDIETGQTYSDKVGKTMTAKGQLALEELVKSIFSWPGATVGLPSKTKVTEQVLPFLKPEQGSVEYTGGSAKLNKQVDTPTQFTPISANNKFSPAPAPKVAPIYKKKKAKFQKQPSRPISALR